MSYCRWSTDDFGCDLYCYADVSGGYTTHVAAHRHGGQIPKLPDLMRVTPQEYGEAIRAQHDYLVSANMAPIGLPCDGKTFNDPDLPRFRRRIVALREMGYRCPDYVLTEIDEEIAEGG